MLAACGASLAGQHLSVYSEFQRVGPDGAVVRADRLEHRREILSPAVARNAFATFRVSAEALTDSTFTLHIAQNPEGTVQASLLEEEFIKSGDEWLPVAAQPVSLPHTATLGRDRRVQTYLLDLWVPASAPVGRFRLEIQMYAGGLWVIYPMEIRIQQAVVPAGPGPATQERPPAPAPGPDDPVDLPVRQAACAYLSGKMPSAPVLLPDSPRAFIDRNLRQDLLLARAEDEPNFSASLPLFSGYATTTALCGATGPAPRGAEWWLRVRDYLYQRLPAR